MPDLLDMYGIEPPAPQRKPDLLDRYSGGPNRSIAGEALTGVARGIVSTPSQMLSAGRAALDVLGMAPYQPAGNSLTATAAALSPAARLLSDQIAPVERAASVMTDVVRDRVLPRSQRNGLWDARGIAGDLGETVPQLGQAAGMSIALGPLGPAGAIAAFAGTSAAPVVGQTYQEAMRAHGDKDRAAQEAAANGAVTAVTSLLPGAAFLRKIPGGNTILRRVTNTVLGRVGVRALAEGTQEATEQVGQVFNEALIREGLSPEQAALAAANPDKLQEYAYAGLLGTLAGGGVSVALETPSQVPGAANRIQGRVDAGRERIAEAGRKILESPLAEQVRALPARPTRAQFEELGIEGRWSSQERADIANFVRTSTTPNQGEVAYQDGTLSGNVARYHTTTNVSPIESAPNQSGYSGAIPTEAELPMVKTGIVPVTPGYRSPLAGDGYSPKQAASITRDQIVRTGGRLFNLPVSVGRMAGSPGAAGTFRLHPDSIQHASKYGGDVGVLTHELAHHLWFNEGFEKPLTADPAVVAELKPLDYDPQAQRDFEGFAELVRWAMTEDSAEQIAPRAFAAFQQVLNSKPEVRKRIGQLRDMIDAVRAQSPDQRVGNQLRRNDRPVTPLIDRRTAVRDWMAATWDTFYKAMVDSADPVKRLVDEARRRGLKMPSGDDPYSLIMALTGSAPSLAEDAFKNGVSAVSAQNFGTRLGPALNDILGSIPAESAEAFSRYVYARHALEAHDKGIEPGISASDAREVYRQYGSRPGFEEAARGLTDYNNSLLDMLADVGVISEEEATTMKDAWLTYVPLRRVRAGHRESSQASQFTSPLKARKGADLPIVNPISVTMQRTVELYQRAIRQVAINALVSVYDQSVGLGNFMRGLTPTDEPQTTKQVKADLEARGIDLSTLPGSNISKWFIFNAEYQSGPEYVVRVTNNGQTRHFLMNKDLFSAIQAMQPLSPRGVVAAITYPFRAATRGVRLGATALNPAFAAPNLIRDIQTSFLQTKEANPAAWAGAMGRAAFDSVRTDMAGAINSVAGTSIKGDALVERLTSLGLKFSTGIGQDLDGIYKAQRAVYNRPQQVRALRLVTPKNFINTLREGIAVLEVVPRIAEAARTLKRNGYTRADIEAGKVPRRVVIEMLNDAQDVTLNFKRSGSIGRVINQYVAFWNAWMQGLDKMGRTVRDNPGLLAARLAPFIAITVAYWDSVKDEDWYKDSPDWLKYGFWTFSDDKGKPIARIPRPFDWGWLFFSGVEATLNAINEEDPQLIAEYLTALKDRMAPSFVPDLFTAATQFADNKDYFRNREIVDDQLARFEARDQYNPDTTLLMREFGKAFNISPARMEFLVNELTGGGYSNWIRLAEGLVFDSNNKPQDAVFRGLSFSNDYSDALETLRREHQKVEQAYNSSRILTGPRGELGDGDRELGDTLARLNWYAGVLADIRDQVPRDGTREERFEIMRYAIGLARQATGEEPLDSRPSPFSVPLETLPESVRPVVIKMRTSLTDRINSGGDSLRTIQSRRRAQALWRELRGPDTDLSAGVDQR